LHEMARNNKAINGVINAENDGRIIMKIKGMVIAVFMTALIILAAACGTAYPKDLLAAENRIATVQGSDVETIKTGTAYGDIITKLGATRDDGVGEDAHTAVYLVDGDSFLYLSFAKFTDKCSQSGEELLAGVQSAIGISGEVTDIQSANSGITMMVESKGSDYGMYDKASVRTDADTVIMRQNGDAAALEEISIGDTVEIVFDGAVAESYPVQGRALRVTILESAVK
jgi:hypothetical protein